MNKEKIIIFGKGAFFRAKKENFFDRYEVVAFLDNSIKEDGIGFEEGIKVYNPNKLFQLPSCDIYCVSADFISMWKQLIDMGVDENRIKFGCMILPLQEGIESAAFSNGEILYSDNKQLVYSSQTGNKRQIKCIDDLKKAIREEGSYKNSSIRFIQNLPVEPISRNFGSERGKAVDRYYIEKFISDNSKCIYGRVLEVANNDYTMKYGNDKVKESVISHVKGWGNNTILCNFESGEGVVDEAFDCIICTQTLQYIFDLQKAINNIYRMLKPGASALITVPGIKPLCRYDNDNWGEHWSFTKNSIEKLLCSVEAKNNIIVKQYGNVKTATAYLYGVSVEELDSDAFDYDDSQYPFLICARITKKE